MARPKSENLIETVQIGVRILPEIKDRLKKKAKKNGHKLSDEIRIGLEKHSKV